MNIKVIIIVVVIAAGLYHVFKPPGKMEVLMTPMEVMPESGVRHVGVRPGSDFDADDLADLTFVFPVAPDHDHRVILL